MRVDEITNRIFVRQSWLKDMMLCPERARLNVAKPEFKTQNDSAAIGTAVHAGIQAILDGDVGTSDAPYVSLTKFKELETAGIKHTNVNPDHWHHHVMDLTEAWVKDIFPSVPTGGKTEVPFSVPTGTIVEGRELWFEGTMDYLHESGVWDWKTAARKYSILEKQQQDIQSSIYTFAAQKLGMEQTSNTFKFGIMIRVSKSYGQIVSVNRTKGHGEFVIKQAASAVANVLAITKNTGIPTDERWLINDQHYLCSQRWCPWWSVCKGAHISESDNKAEEA